MDIRLEDNERYTMIRALQNELWKMELDTRRGDIDKKVLTEERAVILDILDRLMDD